MVRRRMDQREARGVALEPGHQPRRDIVGRVVGQRWEAPHQHAVALLKQRQLAGWVGGDHLYGNAATRQAARELLDHSLDSADRRRVAVGYKCDRSCAHTSTSRQSSRTIAGAGDTLDRRASSWPAMP